MKKINYFVASLFVACIFTSCHVGRYVPSTLNVGGVSTNVVLSQANFRVVRNIEAVIEVNNYNLRRADVEKSAFAELMRKYPLTGSQAYINVVVEEIRREGYSGGGTLSDLKQYVAVRATIIEFLQENGQPVKSVESPYNTASQRIVQEEQAVEEPQTPKPTDMSSLAKLSENKFYMALLLKTGQFDYSKQTEAAKYFNFNELNRLKVQNSRGELEDGSKEHDKAFKKFAK